MKPTKKPKSRTAKLIDATLIGIAIVAFWRGVWGLLDLYLFPNNYQLSLWISALAGLIILIYTRNAIRHFLN